MVKQWQDLFFGSRYSGVELTGNPDFVKIAEAFGAVGFRVTEEDDVEKVLMRAMEIEDKPVIIDAWVDPDEHVYPMIPSGRSVKDITCPSQVAGESQARTGKTCSIKSECEVLGAKCG